MSEKRTTFIDHLEELRKRILYSVAGVGIFAIVGFFFAKKFLSIIIQRASLGTTYFFAPAEAFITQIKVALFLGVVISFPFLLYQTWAFIGPGLTKSERK
ncbi:twin-arginine translocase subunit TatC, partial [candidate division WOR-3 bacterium]|nr:twin-arginine translocase subunit TatC [candidate division WOR-3 bacterium]